MGTSEAAGCMFSEGKIGPVIDLHLANQILSKAMAEPLYNDVVSMSSVKRQVSSTRLL